MKYLRQYEEAGWLKKMLGITDTLEPSGLAKQSTKKKPDDKEEPKKWEDNITSNGSNAPKIVLDYLNKNDNLENIKEVIRKPESIYSGMYLVCITANLKPTYLEKINTNNLFDIKESIIRFEIYPSYTKKEVKINWYIDTDTNNENTRVTFNNPLNYISSVNVHQKKINSIGIVTPPDYRSSIRDQDVDESLNNVFNIIPYFFNKISEKIIAYNESVKRKEEERKRQEEERKKREERINKFKSHMEDVGDYLIDLEDMSEGDVEKIFNQNTHTMVFKFKIDGLEKIGKNTFTVNQKIIDIFKSLNSARERIERKIPNSNITIEFEKTNILYIYIELLESKKEIPLPRDEYGTPYFPDEYDYEDDEEEEEEDWEEDEDEEDW